MLMMPRARRVIALVLVCVLFVFVISLLDVSFKLGNAEVGRPQIPDFLYKYDSAVMVVPAFVHAKRNPFDAKHLGSHLTFYDKTTRKTIAHCPIPKNVWTITKYVFCRLNQTNMPWNNMTTSSRKAYTKECANFKVGRDPVTKFPKAHVHTAILRHPIARLVSAWTDICYRANESCYDCDHGDFHCFVERNYDFLKKFSEGSRYSTAYWRLNHFFPQNWFCGFWHHFKDYKFIYFDPNKPEKFWHDFLGAYESYINPKQIATLYKLYCCQIKISHATTTYQKDVVLAVYDEIKKSEYLQELIFRTYYFDFKLFSYNFFDF